MSVFYQLNGIVPLRFDATQAKKIKKILKRFNERYGEICADFVDDGDGSGCVEVFGGDYMTYVSLENLEGILRELAPFVAEPCFVQYQCDGDNGLLYIGPADRESIAQSAYNFRIIVNELLPDLTDEDKAKLRTALNS